jgi:hypothetical protein
VGKTKRDGAWTHESGDVKADPAKAEGINILPDGNVALTKGFIRDMYEATHGDAADSDQED